MERPTSYTALLDSSVLFPAFISSLLLWIASTRLFRVRWTEQIHTEWIERRLERYPDLNRARLESRRLRMDSEFADSLVTGHEGLIESLILPDPNDRHVLAAAITCRAHVKELAAGSPGTGKVEFISAIDPRKLSSIGRERFI